MELHGRTVALYGRFSDGARASLSQAIEAGGGKTSRDLTRQSNILVVGCRAGSLIASGALLARLKTAHESEKLVFSEAAFRRELAGQSVAGAARLPLPVALSRSGLTADDVRLLAAFDLVVVQGGNCRFGDSAVMQTAATLRQSGSTLADIVSILLDVQQRAPTGRYEVIVGGDGRPGLRWEDGHTTLDGQGVLPLEPGSGSMEDLFEAAILADADGRDEDAARLYDMCARADRKDAIALYNLANIRLRKGDWDEAALAYQRALAREPGFAEARYNLAQALDASGKADAAAAELERLLEGDPDHPDGLFNLAQLRMKTGRLTDAVALYQRYLATSPAAEWVTKARRAIAYCERAKL
jgi:tetratricopeptide (TPR) repeat protein